MNGMELLIDFHKNSDRQGPGSDEETLRALNTIAIAHQPNLSIADIGCGTGAQTMALAKHTKGTIQAVDLFPEFLQQLHQRATSLGVQDRIHEIQASMDKLPFEEETFDIIWSEGAIYIMGFEEGTKYWNQFLKPDGYLAVSEITWTTDERPSELESFWTQAYPEISTAKEKIKVLEGNGYVVKAHFFLDSSSWLNEYYEPMENYFESFLEKHHYSEDAKALVKEHQDEIALFRKYLDYFSYGFYIAKKI